MNESAMCLCVCVYKWVNMHLCALYVDAQGPCKESIIILSPLLIELRSQSNQNCSCCWSCSPAGLGTPGPALWHHNYRWAVLPTGHVDGFLGIWTLVLRLLKEAPLSYFPGCWSFCFRQLMDSINGTSIKLKPGPSDSFLFCSFSLLEMGTEWWFDGDLCSIALLKWIVQTKVQLYC